MDNTSPLIRILTLLCVCLLLTAAVFAQSSPASAYMLEQDFSDGFSGWEPHQQYAYSSLIHHARVLRDTGRKWDYRGALAASPWLEARAVEVRPADSTAVFWVLLDVKGLDTMARRYAFQAGSGLGTWREIDIYLLDALNVLQHKRTGRDVLPGERDVRDAFSFFTLDIPAAGAFRLLLRLSGFYPENPPARISLEHVNPSTMWEWNGYRVGRDFRYSYSPLLGYIVDYAQRSVEILPEPAGGYRLEQVLQDTLWDRLAHYNTWSGHDPNTAYWLRQRLIGDDLASTFYTFMAGQSHNLSWTQVELFVPDERGYLIPLHTGFKTRPAEKPLPDFHNLFQVFVPAGDTVTVYARVRTSLPRLAPANLFFSHFDYNTYKDKLSRIRYWNGLFQGVLWIQLLYSLLLFLGGRDTRELYYSILILGMQLFFISETGFDLTLREWLPTRPEWIFPALNLGSFIAIFGLLKFTSAFLELDKWLPRTRLLVSGCLMVLGCLSLSVLFVKTSWLFQVWRLLTATGILLPVPLGIVAIWKRRELAGIFLLSVSLFAAGSFSHLFSFILFPQGQGDVATYIAFKAGVVAMLSLMAFAVGQQNRILRRDKENALRDHLREQERLNQRLRQFDQLKDQFLANTSHELRTPLTGIIGLAESLDDGVAGTLPDEARRNLRMIAGSGRRLANLVNDILDFSKLRNHELVLQRSAVDLHVAVDIVFTLLRPLADDKKLALINEVPAGLDMVDADENRVQQILLNLVGNAIKFTEKGNVRVGAHVMGARGDEEIGRQRAGRMIELYVRDTGIGIPAWRQDAIFRSFEQGDGSTARAYGGTGLGLAITRQLVELHGGYLRMESTAGEGATFFITLPVASAETAQPEIKRGLIHEEETAQEDDKRTGFPLPAFREQPHDLLKEGAPAGQSARILVVDDEPVNRQVLLNQISLAGYEVHAAPGGEEALALLGNDHSFDLVILDIMMPRMSGYEVCHRLRQHYLPGELPIILLTAKNRSSDLVQGFEAGANDYLTKPFLRDELLSRIRTHLHISRISKASGRFVPHEFLHSLGKDDITNVRLGDHIEQEVTVMFSDIRDYTTLAEQMSPEDNFRFVNAFAGRMGPIIREHGGFVQQYLGDAVMALFRDNPEASLRAAIAMQHATYSHNRLRSQKGRRPIRVGMGLHTGPLIMGIIGDQRRTDAATIADTVNTASRLEGLTKHYGANILISEESRSRLRNPAAFRFRYLGPAQVKGKHQPVNIYECIDGDEPIMLEKKLLTLDVFREVLKSYFRRDFTAAVNGFQEILARHPHDATSRLFLQKASGYLASGVPDDWTGVELMRYK